MSVLSENDQNSNPNEKSRELVYATWRKQRGWDPLTLTDAEGVYFSDSSGKKYLDLAAQLMCSNLGHKNKRVINAISKQAEKLAYVTPAFNTEVRGELAKRLSSVLPAGLKKYFFPPSGTEANEAAVKIARMYNKETGRRKVLSAYNSYHGSTLASQQLTGDFRRMVVESVNSASDFAHFPLPYCYRCPLGLEYPECEVRCADYLDFTIKNEGNVAAVIVEPVTGTNGVIVPPKEYLPKVREITERNDVLLIADEVMSGWGRTGEWFAVDNWNVFPDILTSAKGITGAYLPLGLTATTKRIADYFEDNYFGHGHTYESHPMPMAAAVAAIDEYKEKDLINRSKEMGKTLAKRLEEIKETHRSVGDVRSIGLFGAIEIVKNRNTKEPFNSYHDKVDNNPMMVDKILKRAMESGVYVNAWISHFVIAPPLIIEKSELEAGLDVMDEALKLADKEAL